MNKKELLNLVDKYINNESLPHGKILLEKYLDSFQDKNKTRIDSEMGNKKILEEKIYLEILKNIRREKINILRKIYYSPYYFKIAAAIVLFISLALGAFYISGLFRQKTDLIVWKEKVTGFGEKTILTFMDSTKVTLNSESKLKYPNRFNGGSREVYLEGEAYFEVKTDSSKPFIVNTSALSVTDLGTSFNVYAFPDEKEIAVSLVEGKVQVKRKDSNNEKNMKLLQPLQQLVYSSEEDISLVRPFDLQEATGWKDNILKVTDEPLEKVFIKLERLFGIRFELADKSYAKIKITANFKNDAFDISAEVLKKLTGLKYKTIMKNNKIIKIIFYKIKPHDLE